VATYGNGAAESYTYDINGNALIKTDRNGSVTTYAYDGLGRLTNTSVVTTDGEGDATLTNSYTFRDRSWPRAIAQRRLSRLTVTTLT